VIAQALAAQMLLMYAAVNHRNFDAAQIASAARALGLRLGG